MFVSISSLGQQQPFIIQQMQGYSQSEWSDASVIAFHLALTATYSFVSLLPSVPGEIALQNEHSECLLSTQNEC